MMKGGAHHGALGGESGGVRGLFCSVHKLGRPLGSLNIFLYWLYKDPSLLIFLKGLSRPNT